MTINPVPSDAQQEPVLPFSHQIRPVEHTHNGNQERVYQAIAAGDRLIGDVARRTGLDLDTVSTSLRRLCDANRVRKVGTRPRLYKIADAECLLAEVWK